jgi:hypothetical protein
MRSPLRRETGGRENLAVPRYQKSNVAQRPGIVTMKNLMILTSAALLVASQAQAEFLSCAYSEAAKILRNSTRNGLPSDVNDPRVFRGFLNGSRVRCAMDRDEWVDSCVRTALRTPALLLRPPQTEKDTKPLIDRCEQKAAEAAKTVFEKLKADVRNGNVEPPSPAPGPTIISTKPAHQRPDQP